MDGFYFIPDAQNERIFLGQSIYSALTAYVDLPIQIGIRPEHVHILDDADLGSDTHCRASIMAYENMGNEQLVYFTTADNTIIIRRPPVEKIELGKIKRLYFQTDKIIWFDGKTDQVIETQFAALPALV
jgi:ABC-type sugar transport system ATPase subunit